MQDTELRIRMFTWPCMRTGARRTALERRICLVAGHARARDDGQGHRDRAGRSSGRWRGGRGVRGRLGLERLNVCPLGRMTGEAAESSNDALQVERIADVFTCRPGRCGASSGQYRAHRPKMGEAGPYRLGDLEAVAPRRTPRRPTGRVRLAYSCLSSLARGQGLRRASRSSAFASTPCVSVSPWCGSACKCAAARAREES